MYDYCCEICNNNDMCGDGKQRHCKVLKTYREDPRDWRVRRQEIDNEMEEC